MIFFDDWFGLLRVLIVGVCGYLSLLVLLRVSGKRTLARWNAFDFIVTVAFGSLLATMILSKDTSVAQGVLGFALLVVLQYTVSWLSVRYADVRNLIKSEPTLLLYQGEFRQAALKENRVTEGEIRAAVRSQGISGLEDVEAVILETDGSFSVIRKFEASSESALKGVKGYPGETTGEPTATPS